jgi:hypothetical protein
VREHMSFVILIADIDGDNVAVWTEVSFPTVRLPTDETAGALGISLSSSGWLRCWVHGHPKLIWLPYNLRGAMFACFGARVALASSTGTLTILMFPA